MTHKNESMVIDHRRGSTRDQRATNRNIKRCHASPSTIATGITTCRRRRKTYSDLWEPRMNRYIKQWFADAAADEEEFGYYEPPDEVADEEDQIVSDTPYVEEPFGENSTEKNWTIVSLALLDGDNNMLFACSGITLPRGPGGACITRFVTSARLVKVFNLKRNKDDNLKIAVRLPSNRTINGVLGLYDDYIAIVSSFDLVPEVRPVNFHCGVQSESITASGRAFNSGQLMSLGLPKQKSYPSFGHDHRVVLFPSFKEAALGASLTNSNGDFLGMVHKCYPLETVTLPAACLHRSLMHFGVLEKEDEDIYDAGSSSGGTRSSRWKYSLPEGVRSVVPSGFLRNINFLKSMGYPMPPPLMLELNGRLRNTLEDDFGEVSAWQLGKGTILISCVALRRSSGINSREKFIQIYPGVPSQFFHSKGNRCILHAQACL
ncbi:uncharacterized protein [Lolium perenne]|uniref:uncharacterized protein n=1 Tax=Lolium perenne TaxID=4522 RepID=UPI0021F55BF5|nr:uncharacterized protein LOC127299706 [Lolium perenne]